MTTIITRGMVKGPILTKREAGETLLDSVRRHRAALITSVPTGESLMTIWQIPGKQEAVTTTRMIRESDDGIRERHLMAISTS